MADQAIKDLIYKAQTIGNIEPIEYMIPYPSTQALIEGQNIKFGDQIVYKDHNITNIDFYRLIQQTAHWLSEQGIKPKDNVIIEENEFPQTELMLFGLWHMGARGTILENKNVKIDKTLAPKILHKESNLIEKVSSYPKNFEPEHKALLNETAINIISDKGIIFLSHYGLLVNTNSLQKALELKPGVSLFCDIPPTSSSWVVMKVLLPIYSRCIYTKKNPSIIITFKDIEKGTGFQLRKDWENLEGFRDYHIGVCTENTAAFCIGKTPMHLTDFKIKNEKLWVKGHSVMNGYLNQNKNKVSFKNDYLIIQK